MQYLYSKAAINRLRNYLIKMENNTEKYAGFWIRFLAYLIDGITVNTILWTVIFPILGMLGASYSVFGDLAELQYMDEDEFAPFILSFLPAIMTFNLVVHWLYSALLESSAWQATIGKLAINVIVVDVDGNRINFAKASLRYFGKILSAAIFYIGYIMAAFSPRKQALHDLIANTFVIYKPIQPN